ncbi:MAG: 2-amino-4-hydroxy-6-hydroxymethyldihydropteridine diphosphokinase [Pseudomonadota bacterium]
MSQASNSLLTRREHLLALGANLPSASGPPATTLRLALHYTEQYSCKIVKLARLFRSPAFPAGSGPDYINSAALIEGPADPEEMLALLHKVENDLGRERAGRWGARVIDLDLLATGDEVVPDAETYGVWNALPLAVQQTQTPDELILPHPRLHERAFVLVPLLDVAPDWRHPVLGQTVREMHDGLAAADRAAVVPV